MQKALRLLNTPGGHIVVLLFLIVLGLVAIKLRVPRGEEIMIGALAALWPLLTGQSGPPPATAENQQPQKER